MRLAFLMVFINLFCLIPKSEAQSKNTSFTTEFGEQVLEHTIELPVSIEEAWKYITDKDYLTRWAAPFVSIDLRIGGTWESSYNPKSDVGNDGNIVMEILTYRPTSLCSMIVTKTTKGFKHPHIVKQVAINYELKKRKNKKTLLRLSMVGWKKGKEWDEVYQFFSWGNEYSLNKLYVAITEGPVNWAESELVTKQ